MVEKDSQKDGPTDPDRQKVCRRTGKRFAGEQAEGLQVDREGLKVNRQSVCRWTGRRKKDRTKI